MTPPVGNTESSVLPGGAPLPAGTAYPQRLLCSAWAPCAVPGTVAAPSTAAIIGATAIALGALVLSVVKHQEMFCWGISTALPASTGGRGGLRAVPRGCLPPRAAGIALRPPPCHGRAGAHLGA